MLDKNNFINEIKQALEDLEEYNKEEGATPAEAKTMFATKLADAIDKYVTSGEIKFSANEIQVATTGSATSQTGGNVQPITKSLE